MERSVPFISSKQEIFFILIWKFAKKKLYYLTVRVPHHHYVQMCGCVNQMSIRFVICFDVHCLFSDLPENHVKNDEKKIFLQYSIVVHMRIICFRRMQSTKCILRHMYRKDMPTYLDSATQNFFCVHTYCHLCN